MTAAALFASCTMTEVGFEDDGLEEVNISETLISIPLKSEFDVQDENTKAYLNSIDANSWNYVWEDGDQMAYFRYRKGDFIWGTADVDKNEDGTKVLYHDLKNGDILYTYLFQPEANAAIENQIGALNQNASNLYLSIPTEQASTFESEKFYSEQDLSFSVNNERLSKVSEQLSGNSVPSYENLGSYAAPKNTLLFKISGYHRDVKYASTGTSSFSIDYYGNATAEFQPLPINEMTKTQSTGDFWTFIGNVLTGSLFKETYSAEYPIEVKVEGEDDYTKIVVTQTTIFTASYKKLKLERELNTTYTKKIVKGDAIVKITGRKEGAKKAIPVRNCMPCVSKKYTVKQADVKNPEEIQSYMTMYMLGSVIEFRVYSDNNEIGKDETISMAIFEADKPCAGVGIYNILNDDLEVSEMTENVIESYDYCGQTVGTNKTDDYASIYLVLAPGTYTSDFHIVTNKNVYSFHAADKTYERAVRKAFNINLNSKSCTITPIEEFFPAEGEDEGDGEGTEGGSGNTDDDFS